jgi:hypothetical protein
MTLLIIEHGLSSRGVSDRRVMAIQQRERGSQAFSLLLSSACCRLLMARTLRANDNGRWVGENIAERRAAAAQKKRPKMEIYWPGPGIDCCRNNSHDSLLLRRRDLTLRRYFKRPLLVGRRCKSALMMVKSHCFD